MDFRPIERAKLKAESKELMRTALVSPLLFSALYLVILLLLDLFTSRFGFDGLYLGATSILALFISILAELVSIVLKAGYVGYCMGIRRGEHMPYASLFDGFSFVGKVIGLNLVMGFFVMLWSLLFVIPGLIAIVRYSFAVHFLCQDPRRGVMECIELSKRYTRGYIGQLLLLDLSYFGWFLLVGVLGAGAACIPLIGTAAATLVVHACGVLLIPYITLTGAGVFYCLTAPDDVPPRGNDWTPEF